MGVSWQVRPTAEGVVVVQHGGDLPGYKPDFLLVPAKGFAIILLNNGELGARLTGELFTTDWALRRFVGLHNLPAPPRRLGVDQELNCQVLASGHPRRRRRRCE